MSLPSPSGIAGLPSHFHQEQAALLAAGVHSWEQLANLPRATLRQLASTGLASEARLSRLRAQARLMVGVGLAAEEASLLLHAGIAEPRALAQADPQRLQVQLGRLCRGLLGASAVAPTLATIRTWIRSAASRSEN